MFVVVQKNTIDGKIIDPATSQMTFLQCIDWIEKVREHWKTPKARYLCRTFGNKEPQLWIRQETKNDIVNRMLKELDDYKLSKNTLSKIYSYTLLTNFMIDFDDFWEDV